MTTIAWDGKLLAADRMSITGYLKHQLNKLHYLARPGQQLLFGSSGDYDAGLAVLNWLKEGGDYTTGKDSPSLEREGAFSGLLVVLSAASLSPRVYHLHERCIGVPIASLPFYAIGSGREFAIAAMRLGLNALQAVQVASELDHATGSGLSWRDLEGNYGTMSDVSVESGRVSHITESELGALKGAWEKELEGGHFEWAEFTAWLQRDPQSHRSLLALLQQNAPDRFERSELCAWQQNSRTHP
jgi:hypothetical protein